MLDRFQRNSPVWNVEANAHQSWHYRQFARVSSVAVYSFISNCLPFFVLQVVVEVAEAAVQLSKASLAAADRSVCLGGVQIVYRLIHTDKTRRPHLSRTVRESLEHLLGDAKAKQVDDKTDKLLIASLQDMLSV